MGELRSIPLEQIDEPLHQLRAEVDPGELEELARSIQAVGLLHPIGVVQENDRYRVVYGHRRFLAYRFLGRPGIEVRVLSAAEVADLGPAAAENIQRRDLSPVEEARALRHMVEAQGRSVAQAARAVGRSEQWVRGRLEILLWPDGVVRCVEEGSLPVSVARELVLVEDETVRAHYLRCALESGCTAFQMREWRHQYDLSRLANPEAPWLPRDGEEPLVPRMPQVTCVCCDRLLPVTAAQLVRTCEPCLAIILDEKRRSARS